MKYSKGKWEVGKWYIMLNEGGVPNLTINFKARVFYMRLLKHRLIFGRGTLKEYRGLHGLDHLGYYA